jgi:YfiH family protein
MRTLVSTRADGNFGLHVGDDPARVVANRERFFTRHGLALEDSVWCGQVHEDRVHVVRAGDRGRGARAQATAIPGTDALVTDEPGVALCLLTADCVPVALYDPEHAAIGLAHAGWPGTVARIASRTLAVMRATYGTEPSAVRAGIGPSIAPDRYEVGGDVIARARAAYGDEVLADLGGGKALFDLWRANALDLERAGVERIEIVGVGTGDAFFSHRLDQRSPGTHTGRFATVVTLT